VQVSDVTKWSADREDEMAARRAEGEAAPLTPGQRDADYIAQVSELDISDPEPKEFRTSSSELSYP